MFALNDTDDFAPDECDSVGASPPFECDVVNDCTTPGVCCVTVTLFKCEGVVDAVMLPDDAALCCADLVVFATELLVVTGDPLALFGNAKGSRGGGIPSSNGGQHGVLSMAGLVIRDVGGLDMIDGLVLDSSAVRMDSVVFGGPCSVGFRQDASFFDRLTAPTEQPEILLVASFVVAAAVKLDVFDCCPEPEEHG